MVLSPSISHDFPKCSHQVLNGSKARSQFVPNSKCAQNFLHRKSQRERLEYVYRYLLWDCPKFGSIALVVGQTKRPSQH
jgi:hypothetical protein